MVTKSVVVVNKGGELKDVNFKDFEYLLITSKIQK